MLRVLCLLAFFPLPFSCLVVLIGPAKRRCMMPLAVGTSKRFDCCLTGEPILKPRITTPRRRWMSLSKKTSMRVTTKSSRYYAALERSKLQIQRVCQRLSLSET